MDQIEAERPSQDSSVTLKRYLTVVVFSIAFGYIEAAVVVYLRAIFHPDGFVFPLTEFGSSSVWQRFLLTEIGRESATLVLILSGSWLIGRNRRQRIAYFLTIFAVWDIFYYVWLKVLIGWPGSVMDWDILFLIPVTWASPVLAPVLVSAGVLVFGAIILLSGAKDQGFEIKAAEQIVFVLGGVAIITAFCIGGTGITQADFASYFSWPLFAIGYISIVAVLDRIFRGSRSR